MFQTRSITALVLRSISLVFSIWVAAVTLVVVEILRRFVNFIRSILGLMASKDKKCIGAAMPSYYWQTNMEFSSTDGYRTILDARRATLLEELAASECEIEGDFCGVLSSGLPVILTSTYKNINPHFSSEYNDELVKEWVQLVKERDRVLRAKIFEDNQKLLEQQLICVYSNLRVLFDPQSGLNRKDLPVPLQNSLFAAWTEVRSYLIGRKVDLASITTAVQVAPNIEYDSGPILPGSSDQPNEFRSPSKVGLSNNAGFVTPRQSGLGMLLSECAIPTDPNCFSTPAATGHVLPNQPINDEHVILRRPISDERSDFGDDLYVSANTTAVATPGVFMRSLVLDKNCGLSAEDCAVLDNFDTRSTTSFETTDSRFTDDSASHFGGRKYLPGGLSTRGLKHKSGLDTEALYKKALEAKNSEVD